MPKPLIWGAGFVILGFGALYLWSRFSTKRMPIPYTMGMATGAGVGFMDTSRAQSGVTPDKGGVDKNVVKPASKNAWGGAYLAIRSTMPTINPVPVQAKEIFWSSKTAPFNKQSWS